MGFFEVKYVWSGGVRAKLSNIIVREFMGCLGRDFNSASDPPLFLPPSVEAARVKCFMNG